MAADLIGVPEGCNECAVNRIKGRMENCGQHIPHAYYRDERVRIMGIFNGLYGRIAEIWQPSQQRQIAVPAWQLSRIQGLEWL